jgi:hypothetical protein
MENEIIDAGQCGFGFAYDNNGTATSRTSSDEVQSCPINR